MHPPRAPFRRDRAKEDSGPGLAVAALLFATSLHGLACGDSGGRGSWAGVVDTLPGGIVRVQNPEEGVWDSTTAWRLADEVRIGTLEGGGPEVFGYVSGLAVDGLGRIYVLDRQAKEVRVFDERGSYVRTVGREGEGPGELEDPIGLALRDGGRLWVVDPGNARYSVFDTSGAFVASHPRRVGAYSVPWRGGFDERGRLYEATLATTETRSGPALVVLDASLAPRDTIWIPKHQADVFELVKDAFRMTADVPFASRQVWTPGPDGTIWTGITGDYRIARLSRRGDTLRIIEKEFTAVPVTGEERSDAVEGLGWFVAQGGKIDPSSIPGVKPAFSSIHVAPDGHLWVVPTLPDGHDGSAFDVFDPAGRYLGRLHSPLRLQTAPEPVFRAGRLYARVRGGLDVPYVVRLRVDRPGS